MSTQYSTGKGLAALLGDIADTAHAISKGQFSEDRALSVDMVVPGKQQPRQLFDDEKLNDLVDSISKNGVLQPIVVRKLNDELYEIIAGERRYRASIKAGLTKIPAIVIDCTDTEALEIGLVENLQRDDLNPMDEAEAYLRLVQEHGKTQEEVAKAVSKSRSYVANQIRLTQLPGRVKELVREKRISPGHARNLVNNPQAEDIADQIMREGLNVRQTEMIRHREKNPNAKRVENEDVVLITQKLQELLGMRVKVTAGISGGAITIYFNSYDQLDALIQKLDS